MKDNQKGFTLVELILVVAILGIMATVIGVFVGTGSSSFRSLSRNAKTQIELQKTMDQIGEVLMNTGNCLNVNEDTNGQVKKLETFSYADHAVGELDAEGNPFQAQKQVDMIEYDQEKRTVTWQRQRCFVYQESSGEYIADAEKPSILSEKVTDFRVDVSETAEKGTVTFTMTVEERGYAVQLEESVRVRNQILVNHPGYDFSDVEEAADE